MSNVSQIVVFNNQELIAVEQGNVLYVALKQICDNIGISWRGQQERIERDEILNSVKRVIRSTGSDGKFYKMLCLPIQFLNGWLFGVDSNRVKTEQAKENLAKYKLECFGVLYNYWHKGEAVNPRLSDLSTTQDCKPLVKAVEMLVEETGAIFSNVWRMVWQRFNVTSVEQLTIGQVKEAIEYIHSLFLHTVIKPHQTNNLAIMDCGKKLIHHMNYIYSWYRAIEQPFKMLSPKLNAEIHDHMQDGKIFATSLARHLNIDEPMPKKYWSISR